MLKKSTFEPFWGFECAFDLESHHINLTGYAGIPQLGYNFKLSESEAFIKQTGSVAGFKIPLCHSFNLQKPEPIAL